MYKNEFEKEKNAIFLSSSFVNHSHAKVIKKEKDFENRHFEMFVAQLVSRLSDNRMTCNRRLV
jgi:hypothetical protein